MNPFDEIAVEEAIRLKEAGKAEEVIAVSIGVQAEPGDLRTALAMGADRGILVVAADDVPPTSSRWPSPRSSKPWSTKKRRASCLCGKQAIDNDMNATGQMLAALLGWAQATFCLASWTSTATRQRHPRG